MKPLNTTDTPRQKLEAEVEELNRLMIGWKQRATMSETDLEASNSKVESLRGQLNSRTDAAIADLKTESETRHNLEAEVERLRGQLTRAVSIASVLLSEIEDFHGNATDDEWTTSGWNDSRISKSLLQKLREEIDEPPLPRTRSHYRVSDSLHFGLFRPVTK